MPQRCPKVCPRNASRKVAELGHAHTGFMFEEEQSARNKVLSGPIFFVRGFGFSFPEVSVSVFPSTCRFVVKKLTQSCIKIEPETKASRGLGPGTSRVPREAHAGSNPANPRTRPNHGPNHCPRPWVAPAYLPSVARYVGSTVFSG